VIEREKEIITRMDYCIGTDILDIGSRRAEIKLRQQQQRLQNDFMNPTHFDVPNVSNVCVRVYNHC
jgi:hypothetical protein